MLGLTCQLRAKRIACPIRKPRNNADEAIAAKPGWDGASFANCGAICCVAPLANGPYHWLRVASCISSRRASVATTRDLFRGSLLRLDRVRQTRGLAAVRGDMRASKRGARRPV